MLYHIFCLFGLFHPTQEFFLHMETSTLLTKGCKFWPIQSTHGHGAVHEGSLACHTYCDMGHQCIMVISEDDERLAEELSLPVERIRFFADVIRTLNLPRSERSNQLRHRRGYYFLKMCINLGFVFQLFFASRLKIFLFILRRHHFCLRTAKSPLLDAHGL